MNIGALGPPAPGQGPTCRRQSDRATKHQIPRTSEELATRRALLFAANTKVLSSLNCYRQPRLRTVSSISFINKYS